MSNTSDLMSNKEPYVPSCSSDRPYMVVKSPSYDGKEELSKANTRGGLQDGCNSSCSRHQVELIAPETVVK